MSYFTINDLISQGVQDVFVFLRPDLNTTLIDGRAPYNERIKASHKTIKKLSDAGAKTIIGAHNGRKGDPSFVSLGILLPGMPNRISGNISYIGNTYIDDRLNTQAVQSIRGMRAGETFLLENLRFLSGESAEKTPEEHAQTPLIRTLIDDIGVRYYVNDSFSVSHRQQGSIVGFSELPCIAGITMEKELTAANRVLNYFAAGEKTAYVLGGAKISDYMQLIRNSLQDGRVQKIMVGGLFGNLCLYALGYDLGKPNEDLLKEKKLWKEIENIKGMITDHKDIFVVPTDVAYNIDGERKEYYIKKIPKKALDHPVMDIGSGTIRDFSRHILASRMVYLKGPMGVYEKENFNEGSRNILTAMAGPNANKIYTVMGGGDTSSMLAEFGIPSDKINFVSLSGGALIMYIAGYTLPGVTVLEESYKRFNGRLQS
ncbi:MAG: phosphoglycerate kinase [Nanoarchaeota archaeon]